MAGENINRRLNIYINDKQIVNSQRGIANEMAKVKNELRNLDKGAADYNDRLAELTDTYRMLRAEHQDFANSLNETPSLLGSIKDALGPVASGILTAFSVEAIFEKFVGSISQAIEIIIDFDQKQADLAAIMGKSRTGIAKLTADALKYGASTAYNSAQVSELQTELARLGKTEKEIRAMTESVLTAATALEAELGPAAELIGGQLNSYGADARESARYSDIMANSVNISATSFESLSTALPKVSKVAYLNNVSFEKLNATLGVLADENIAAETAGTGFRNILLESAKTGKPYEKMLQQIKNSTDQSKTATELFGKENATVAVILANSTQKIKDNTVALENSAGAADKLAKEKMNSIAGSLELFSGAWEGFILNIEKGDGIIGKAIKGVIDMGAGLLGLITPTRQLSDELKEEQFNLNMLVQKIQSSNTTNEERKRLLQELKSEYPAFNKYLDVENATTAQIWEALRRVNEEYVKRIALQGQVERVEKASGKVAEKILKQQEKLFKISQELTKYNLNYKLNVQIDEGNLVGSAKKMREVLQKRGGVMEEGASDVILSMIKNLGQINGEIKSLQGDLDEEMKKQQFMEKSLNIQTEAQRADNDAIKEKIKLREELIKQAREMGMKDPEKKTYDELKRWIELEKERRMYTDEMSEEDKKKLAKAIADAKKHAEDLLKTEQDLQKKLLEAKRSGQDLANESLKDGYDRERTLLNQDYDRKIEDAKNNIAKEDQEIAKLRKAIADKSTSQVDRTSFKKQMETRKQIAREMDATLLSLEQTRNLKLAALQEKYLDLEFKKQEEANAREVAELQNKQNIELSAIISLKQAKELLDDSLSEKELFKIKTLEDAKKKIKEQYLKEQYTLQEKQLIDLMARVQEIFNTENDNEIQLISPEKRDELLKFLDELALKLSSLGVNKAELKPDSTGAEKTAYSGLDILGFTTEEWEAAFNALDTFEGKLKAIKMVTESMGKAFGSFFDFLDARDARSLQKYQGGIDRRKKEQQTLLDKGYISQEVYSARIEKLDAEMAKKKAEIEYKEAKRRKILSLAQAVISTAQGVAAALSGPPPTSYIFAGITAAMGALEIATIASTPLPSRSGFKKGGYTGDGSADTEAGPVHKGEYVIPKNVLFDKDPVMPHIVGYVEAKRTGKKPTFDFPEDNPEEKGNASAGDSSALTLLCVQALDRNSAILEKIEENGMIAYVELDIKTAKKIRTKIKELETIENTSKK